MNKGLKGPLQTVVACAVVGVLAGLGAFNSITNFPVVFAAVCLLLGSWSLWRDQPRESIPLRGGILLLAAALPIAGWLYQQHEVEQSLIAGRERALSTMLGQTVPDLVGLDPLNTDRTTWDAAASLTAPATVVTFWARWCSPCEKEMPVLEELYREHRARGLQVLAVTKYDRPDDEQERRSDFAKAQSFLTKRDLTYPAAITDDDELYRAFEAHSIPRTVLIDDQGRVVDYAISLESVQALAERAVELVSTSAG